VRSPMVLAAIAYSDAVTARFLGRVNQVDHAALPKLLRDALGNQLPDAQMRRLRRILQEKDETQYGARLKSRDEAQRLLEDRDQLLGDLAEARGGGAGRLTLGVIPSALPAVPPLGRAARVSTQLACQLEGWLWPWRHTLARTSVPSDMGSTRRRNRYQAFALGVTPVDPCEQERPGCMARWKPLLW